MSVGDEYLRCERCGLGYPITTTAVGERCACDGELIAVREVERPDVGPGAYSRIADGIVDLIESNPVPADGLPLHYFGPATDLGGSASLMAKAAEWARRHMSGAPGWRSFAGSNHLAYLQHGHHDPRSTMAPPNPFPGYIGKPVALRVVRAGRLRWEAWALAPHPHPQGPWFYVGWALTRAGARRTLRRFARDCEAASLPARWPSGAIPPLTGDGARPFRRPRR